MQTLYNKSSSKRYYSVGSGGSGQLLLGDSDDHQEFKEIKWCTLFENDREKIEDFEENLKKLVLGGTIGLGVTKKGEIYTWGEYFENQKLKVRLCPLKIISNPIKIEKISCGWAHNLCLSTDNELYGWGETKYGQLGIKLESNFYCEKPYIIPIKTGSKRIKDIYAGFRQSYVVIANSKNLMVTGSNKFLELGHKFENHTIFKFECISIETEGILNELSTGQKHVLCLDDLGNVFGWGSNKFGQLGFKNNTPESQYLPIKLEIKSIILISSGWSHNLLLTNNLKLFACGRGDFGQQGDGSRDHSFSFHEIEFPCVNSHYENLTSESCYVMAETKLFVWGWNEHGNLGSKDRDDRLWPTELEMNGLNQNTNITAGGAALILDFSEE